MLDLPVIMLGILVGAIIAAKEICSSRERNATQTSSTQPTSNSEHTYRASRPRYTPQTSQTFRTLNDSVTDILRDAAHEANARTGIPRQAPSEQRTSETVSSTNFLESWRKSIVGLIRLAENNLQIARSQAQTSNHRAATEAATTSVENISRALLHCYGEKPDLNAGQEEPLRLLARRFQGEEKAQFQRAIDAAVQLYRNNIVQTYLSRRIIQAVIPSITRTEEILDMATEIVAQFRQIIDEHFATEIPELRDRCPKCHALNITLWTFNPQGSTCQCNMCTHTWTQTTP